MNKWNIPNAAGKIEPAQIEQLPLPFIAYTNNREFPLSLITKVTGTGVEFYSENYNKPVLENKESFLKNWTGIYLIAEPTGESGEKDYALNKRKAFVRNIIPVSLLVLAIGLSFFTLYKSVSNAGIITFNTAGIYLQYFLLFVGVVVSTLLLWYEIDKK